MLYLFNRRCFRRGRSYCIRSTALTDVVMCVLHLSEFLFIQRIQHRSNAITVAAAVTDTASCTFSITSSSVYRHSGGTHVIIIIITTIMMTWQRMYMHHSETEPEPEAKAKALHTSFRCQSGDMSMSMSMCKDMG